MTESKLTLVTDKFAPGASAGVEGGGGGGNNGDMDARVAALEALAGKTGERLTSLDLRLTRMETKLDATASKGDLEALRADIADARADTHKAIAENHRWTHTALVGFVSLFVIGLLGLLFTIWNGSKQSTGPQAPVIINIPTPVGPVPLQPTPNFSSPLAPPSAAKP